jgi:Flp pilus assembly protein TadG
MSSFFATRSRSRRGRAGRRGQSLVEFALVLPIFLLLIMGVIDVGRYAYMSSTLSNAAREGARTGSVEASWKGQSGGACAGAAGQKCPATDPALLADIKGTADVMNSPFGPVAAAYMRCTAKGSVPAAVGTNITCSPNATSGQISVRVTQSWSALTPIIGQILGTRTLEGSSTFVIN